MPREKRTTPENIDRSAVDVGVAHVDNAGKRWISAVAVADIWNYRAKVEYGVEGANYTRFSVRGRRVRKEREEAGRAQSLPSFAFRLGKLERHLYGEEEAWTIPLAPHANSREINTSGMKKDLITGQFLPKSS